WGAFYFLALTNGTADGVPPVAIGREADVPENFDWSGVDFGEGGTPWPGSRLWWAHPTAGEGGTVTWQKEPLRAFVPVDGTPGALDLTGLDSLFLRANDRLEIILGDDRIVRNQRVQSLNDLVPDTWQVWQTYDINNSGVILATA